MIAMIKAGSCAWRHHLKADAVAEPRLMRRARSEAGMTVIPFRSVPFAAMSVTQELMDLFTRVCLMFEQRPPLAASAGPAAITPVVRGAELGPWAALYQIADYA